MGIYDKLFNIQQALKSPKNLKNDFGGYAYRSAENILANVKPLLAENDCLLILTDEVVNIGDSNYVKATAKLIDLEDGSSVEAVALAKEDVSRKGMTASQLTGSASSYGRKYALCGVLAIDDSSADPDSNQYHTAEQNRNSLIRAVKAAGKRNKIDTDAWLTACNRTWDNVAESELQQMLQTITQRADSVA